MELNCNIFKLAKENNFFRKEIITGKNSQVVLMSIPPAGEIGEEVHDVDQTLVFVSGRGEAILEDKITAVGEGDLTFVPAGTKHNFKNTGSNELKLFTLYAPPEHPPGTIHKTKAEAEAEEHD